LWVRNAAPKTFEAVVAEAHKQEIYQANDKAYDAVLSNATETETHLNPMFNTMQISEPRTNFRDRNFKNLPNKILDIIIIKTPDNIILTVMVLRTTIINARIITTLIRCKAEHLMAKLFVNIAAKLATIFQCVDLG